ncbi:MAG: elongation factor Ts [Chloroflexi bacterium]|nr:MAG: elongation factor Ts [Actinobacteria bacterium 13_2_20CM_2_66_6]TME03876.1 MAG: elongation factor Ts [Chloroflexota bacterium]TME91148.1 MAG: elongation factor Ts [Chloroflexota bacterium]
MMDCKHALEEADGDVEKAFTILREKGIARAVKRAGRSTGQGVVEAYLHRTTPDFPPQVGVLIEVDCETDFVAKGEDFRKLAKELALQVAAATPRWLNRDDIPDQLLVEERNLYERKAEQDGKPPQAIPKIVDGQVEKFIQENVLLEQPYFREPKRIVKDLIAENISKLQENIVVRRFARFNVREADDAAGGEDGAAVEA